MPDMEKIKAVVYCHVGSAEQLSGKNRTALYCRSAQACDMAVATQEWQLRKFAEDNGYENPICYIDNGASGITLDRPLMNRLLSDIRGGRIETVIAKDAARIARDYALFFQFFAETQKYGVKVVTVVEGETIPIVKDLVEGIAAQLANSHR